VQARDFSLVYANQAAAELLECSSAEELLSTPLEDIDGRFEILDEHGRPFPPAAFPARRALAGEEVEPTLFHTVSRATGRERWTRVKATPVRDEQGQTVLAVNLVEDITEIRRDEQHQRLLAAAGKLVASSLDLEETLDKVAWSVVPSLADWCCVDLPDERGVVRRRALAGEPARQPPPDPAAGAAVLDGGPSRLEGHDLLTVPLVAGDRRLGLLTLGTGESGRTLGRAEVAVTEELRRRAGVAIENARVHAERTHIATTLQRSLLPPRLPVVPGITIAARFRAAGETTDVGGDFYDIFPAGDAWMVVIGDVTGKGPAAASITSVARYTMRTAALYERSPARVLARLDGALLATDPEGGRLCTAVCARIDPATEGGAEVTVACGGHPQPLLLRAREARPVGRLGPLLGAFRSVEREEQRVRLAPGESLVLYTDGVTDTRGADGRFGQERLAAVLRGAGGQGADDIAARIDDALVAFETGPQRDDVALLVLQADREAVPGATAVAGELPDRAG